MEEVSFAISFSFSRGAPAVCTAWTRPQCPGDAVHTLAMVAAEGDRREIFPALTGRGVLPADAVSLSRMRSSLCTRWRLRSSLAAGLPAPRETPTIRALLFLLLSSPLSIFAADAMAPLLWVRRDRPQSLLTAKASVFYFSCQLVTFVGCGTLLLTAVFSSRVHKHPAVLTILASSADHVAADLTAAGSPSSLSARVLCFSTIAGDRPIRSPRLRCRRSRPRSSPR